MQVRFYCLPTGYSDGFSGATNLALDLIEQSVKQHFRDRSFDLIVEDGSGPSIDCARRARTVLGDHNCVIHHGDQFARSSGTTHELQLAFVATIMYMMVNTLFRDQFFSPSDGDDPDDEVVFEDEGMVDVLVVASGKVISEGLKLSEPLRPLDVVVYEVTIEDVGKIHFGQGVVMRGKP